MAPIDLENPVIDYAAGLLLAWGVSTALYHRERTRRGHRIDVSLLQTSLVLQNNTVNHIDVVDNEWRATCLEQATDALATGASCDDGMTAPACGERIPFRAAVELSRTGQWRPPPFDGPV